MNKKTCAYCGIDNVKLSKDHVIPKCLYSPVNNDVERITVPACKECNNSFSVDETIFRNAVVMGSDYNKNAKYLWNDKIKRSFTKKDGHKIIHELSKIIKPAEDIGKDRLRIYPAESPSVLRVVNKIVRGLCHYHNIDTAISEDRVLVDVLSYNLPESLLEEIIYEHRNEDIVSYFYHVEKQANMESSWLLTFFRNVKFIAVVLSR